MSMHLTLMGNASRGLPRNGLVALYDPYRDAYGLDATARAALQTGVDYSGRGNNLTYGATTGASTDDPVNTGTAWIFDGGDYLKLATPIAASEAVSQIVVFTTSASFQVTSILTSGKTGTPYAGIVAMSQSIRICAESSGNKEQEIGVLGGNTTYCVMGVRTKTSIYGYLGATKGNVMGSLNTTANGLREIGHSDYSTGLYLGAGVSVSLVAHYNRVLTDAEYIRSYRYLKSLMAQRGVTLS